MTTVLKMLGRTRRFSLAIVGTLAIGIGGATALWSIVSQLGTAYQLTGADATVWLMSESPKFKVRTVPTAEQFLDWKQNLRSFEALSAFAPIDAVMRLESGGRQLRVLAAGYDLSSVLRIVPINGRALDATDEQGAKVAMVAEDFARTHFSRSDKALGKVVVLDGTPYEIVGVFPPTLASQVLPGEQFDCLIGLTPRGPETVHVIGRLRSVASRQQAETELQAHADRANPGGPADIRWRAVPSTEMIDSRLSGMFRAALAGGLVLLIVTCTNLAHLLKAWHESHRKSHAIRWALGATPARLLNGRVQQIVLWAATGAIGAGLLARWAVHAITAMAPPGFAFLQGTALRGDTFALAFGLSVTAMLIISLLNAGQSSPALIHDLRTDARFGRPARFGNWLGQVHVVTLVASAFVLAVGAYQVSTSIGNLSRVDLGFRPDGLQSSTLRLPSWKLRDQAQRTLLVQELAARLSAVPGLSQFAVSSGVPLSAGVFAGEVGFGDTGITAKGIGLGSVGPGYFLLVGQRIAAGREFSAEEVRNGAQVVILSETASRAFGAPQRAIGQWVSFNRERREVVGVVGDIRAPGLVDALKGNHVYWPLSRPRQGVTVLVRAPASQAGMFRTVVANLDSDVAAEVVSMPEAVERKAGETRFLTILLGLMATIAIAMSISGVYASLSNFIASQRGGISLRVAIGATESRIWRWVIWTGVSRTLPGLVLGLIASFPFSRLLSTHLFALDPDDLRPRLFALGAILFSVLVATALPAFRAGRVPAHEVLKES